MTAGSTSDPALRGVGCCLGRLIEITVTRRVQSGFDCTIFEVDGMVVDVCHERSNNGGINPGSRPTKEWFHVNGLGSWRVNCHNGGINPGSRPTGCGLLSWVVNENSLKWFEAKLS